MMDWQAALAWVRAENIKKGVCVNCGGAGIVADMGKIERTGDPHASRRCGTCKGTGQPKSVTASPEGGPR